VSKQGTEKDSIGFTVCSLSFLPDENDQQKRCVKGRTTTRYYINHFQISNKTLISLHFVCLPFLSDPKTKMAIKIINEKKRERKYPRRKVKIKR
jgi:hypothetical protein